MALMLAALAVGGCATSAIKLAPERPDRPWTPSIDASGAIVPTTRARSAASASGYVLPADPALAAVPAGPTLDPAHPFSLAELVDIAQSNNPSTRIAWNDARNAALEAGIVRSSTLPQVRGSAVGGYRTSGGRVSALDETADGGSDDSGLVTAVSLNWLLFDFGERRALVAAARQQAIVADIAFTAAHQRITHDVALAFYAVIAARTHVANAGQALATAQAVQAAAEDRLKRGLGTAMEVAQSRQATAQAQLLGVQARAAASDARLRLVTAMGVSPFASFQVEDVSGREVSPAMADLAEKAVGEALSRRPDMLSALAMQKASQAGVRAAEAAFLPKVFTSATAAYNRSSIGITAIPGIGDQLPAFNVNGRRTSGTVLVGVSVPLFDGGVRAAKLDQARSRAGSAEAALAQTRDRAVLEIVSAENALRASTEALEATRAVAAAAQTSFDAAYAAYRHGVGSITDVNLAQQQLIASANATADARSAALSAAATLALATGSVGSASDPR